MADARENVNTIQADDGTTWIEIAGVGTEDEANLLRGFLEAEGIDSQVENVKFTEAPTTFGAMGDIRIYVAEADQSRAMSLLRERNEAYEKFIDDDADTVMTDDGVAEIDDNAETEVEE